jgi:predicted RNA-binding protein with PIN domain
MFYLIDGYNFVLNGGLARTLSGPGNLERARSRLIGWLSSSLGESERAKTTIVFDAKPGSIEQKDVTIQGIRILFAVDYEDADTLLEELIARHSAPKQLTVVSSDVRVQAAAKRRRARAVKSEEWRDDIEARLRQQPTAMPIEEKPIVGDRDSLIAEFDTVEIQRMIEEEIAKNKGKK